MSYRDREIMSRWAEGESAESIASVMRLTSDEVMSVVNRYKLDKAN